MTIGKDGTYIDVEEEVQFYYTVHAQSAPTSGELLIEGTKDATAVVTVAADGTDKVLMDHFISEGCVYEVLNSQQLYLIFCGLNSKTMPFLI